jgi:hypothetical protein
MDARMVFPVIGAGAARPQKCAGDAEAGGCPEERAEVGGIGDVPEAEKDFAGRRVCGLAHFAGPYPFAGLRLFAGAHAPVGGGRRILAAVRPTGAGAFKRGKFRQVRDRNRAAVEFEVDENAERLVAHGAHGEGCGPTPPVFLFGLRAHEKARHNARVERLFDGDAPFR